jgi:PGF-pre-PGF domain-containing protein
MRKIQMKTVIQYLFSHLLNKSKTSYTQKFLSVYLIIVLVSSFIIIPIISTVRADVSLDRSSSQTFEKEKTVETIVKGPPSTPESPTKSTRSEPASTAPSTPSESSTTSEPSSHQQATSSTTSEPVTETQSYSHGTGAKTPDTETVDVDKKTVEDTNITLIKPGYILQIQKDPTGFNENNSVNQISGEDGGNDEEKILESNIGTISKNQQFISVTADELKNETVIQQVAFEASNNFDNVTLKVSDLNEKPVEIKKEMPISKNAKVYAYVDIKLTSNEIYIGESGISEMNFTFVVNKIWIQEYNMDKYSIKMMRYHNDSWETLDTEYLNETELTISYKSSTPGLSIFAVVGDQIIEDSDAIVEDSATLPWWIPFSAIASASTALGIVLVKKRFIYRI